MVLLVYVGLIDPLNPKLSVTGYQLLLDSCFNFIKISIPPIFFYNFHGPGTDFKLFLLFHTLVKIARFSFYKFSSLFKIPSLFLLSFLLPNFSKTRIVCCWFKALIFLEDEGGKIYQRSMLQFLACFCYKIID